MARKQQFDRTRSRSKHCSPFWTHLFPIAKLLQFLCLALLTLTLGLVSSQHLQVNSPVRAQTTVPQELTQQGQAHYQQGAFSQAIDLWQQADRLYQHQNDRLNQAVVSINLAQAYQQLSQWESANAAIAKSLDLLEAGPESRDRRHLLAQAWNTQGSLLLAQSQLEPALQILEQATTLYTQLGDRTGQIRSQLNQAQVLRALGFHRRALSLLTTVNQTFTSQPDSTLKAAGLRQLGNTLRLVGDLEQAHTVLTQSLRIATALASPTNITATWLSLGATAEAQKDTAKALQFYAEAATTAEPYARLQALVNQLALAVKSQQGALAQDLTAQIQQQLPQLPINRTAVLTRLSFAKTLLTAEQTRRQGETSNNPQPTLLSIHDIAQLLASTSQQAQRLGDIWAESYAIGTLGHVYELTEQSQDALALTQTALRLAQSIEAPELIYQWQWQQGRLHDAAATTEPAAKIFSGPDSQNPRHLRHHREAAISHYDAAIQTLDTIRTDLLPIDADLQFNFRNNVEPVYRQFVDLLLRTDRAVAQSPQNLRKVLDTIDALQLAELEDFLRCNLAVTSTVPVEQEIARVDPQAAFIYPIVLAQRLEIMVKLPGQPLTHRSVAVSQAQVETEVEQLQRKLQQARFTEEVNASAQQLYDWLITPIAADLERLQADHLPHTLVFVLDSALQNIPMAVLYHQGKYLVETYAIAVIPSRQLFDPRPRNSQRQVLTAGVSTNQTVDNIPFAALPFVEQELQTIRQVSQTKRQPLLNHQFTQTQLQQEVDSAKFFNVHIATHGEFSSDPNQTYILAWGQRINLLDLERVLQIRRSDQMQTIELLVLSACKTATGNRRAALGLAGVAAQARVRTTVATLWQVTDATTAALMAHFYQELNQGKSIAEALRQAQLLLLQDIDTRRPYYWAPFVIVGNWT